MIHHFNTTLENPKKNPCRSLEIRNWKLPHQGLTLVELMVSMAITSILMLGMSVFFSSTFHNLFQAQKQTDVTQRQFAVNEIIRSKFANLQEIIEIGSKVGYEKDWVLIKNKVSKKQLPFSYISHNDNWNLVFKDLILFNKIILNADEYLIGSPGIKGGKLLAIGKNDSNNQVANPTKNPSLTASFHNMAGFDIADKSYFIAMPTENKVIRCDCDSGSCTKNECTDLINNLKSPTDVAISNDRKKIYVSNSEKGEIIEYEIESKKSTIIASNLKYPTGLAYYENKGKPYLFIAETLNHQIKRIDLNDKSMVTIMGDSDNKNCDNSTKDCALNLPTGLYLDIEDPTKPERTHLFIGDSGNNRVLKMSNGPVPKNINFSFKLDDHYALDKIEIENANWVNGGSYNPNKVSNPNKKLIGDPTHFKVGPAGKVFQNNTTMTIFDGSATQNCQTSGNDIYIEEDINSLGLSIGDWINLNGTGYKVNNLSLQSCNPAPDTTQKSHITVDQGNLAGLSSGKVHLSNPMEVEIPIDGINLSSNSEGFQLFTIKTYDKVQGLVSTSYYTERVGDDLLGNTDDIVEVVSDESSHNKINFPTGVSNRFFISSGEKKIKAIADPNVSNDVTTIDIDKIDTFDYVSDFKIKEGELKFIQNKNDHILNLFMEAEIDDTKTQNYTINAVIPQ